MTTIAETFDLALQHHQAGNLRQAEQLYRFILQADPWHAAVHNNLGLALAGQGRLDDAMVHYRQTLQLDPNSADANNNLANVLVSQGKPAEAETHCREALRLRPDFPEGLNNLGNALQDQRKLEAAVDSYRRALQLQPNLAEAHYNLGNALRELGKLDEAVTWFQSALRLKPDLPFAHNNLGNAFLKQGRLDLALASFQQALRLQPDLAVAQSNRLFCLNYDAEADPDAVFAEHCRWGHARESGVRNQGSGIIQHRLTTEYDPERRLRIGYVSPDLRYHALTRYFEPALAHHDPRQVEVFCYAELAFPDAVTNRLQNLAQGWRWTCNQTDAQVAERIRGDRIDILLDLAGHTAGNRLGVFAHKPAPVQATWLGYMNTTGLTAVDYRLTDDLLDPPAPTLGKKGVLPLLPERPGGAELQAAGAFPAPVRDTEELVRLPGGMCCFGPPADAPVVAALPALRRGYLTFGSLHSLFKLNGRVLDLWSQVLKALPSARLLMFRDTLTGTAREHICRQFAERGIAGERLDLRRGSDAPGYLGIYAEIDVGLDTLPYSGGVTTCESLWMGVPVLTLWGVRPAGRNSAALLARAGLADWTVQTPDQYVTLAAGLGNNLERLAQLRTKLRDQVAGTLCDAGRFTRTLEDAYRNMWRRWCIQQRQETPNPKPQIPNKSN